MNETAPGGPAGDRCPASRAARFLALALGSVGVVYGDIGTSPLYAFREAVVAASARRARHPRDCARRAVPDPVGADHLVTIKYVLILLRADNNGEGGTLSLTALASRAWPAYHAGRWVR